jgi:ethanolamine utilization protein EutN
MQFGIVKGTVVATQKVKELKGLALKVLLPCDDKKELVGQPIVVVDTIGARPGDFVMWVGKREASLAIPEAALSNNYPVDAAITGIIDDIG